MDIFLHVGRIGDDHCPVAALLAFIAVRGGSSGPLFCHPNGRLLTSTQVVAARGHAGHSFRTEAATTAAECGLEDSLIKALDRWESEA